MTEKLTFIQDFVLVLVSSFIGGFLAKKLRFPLIVGYLLSGVITGSIIIKYVDTSVAIKNIAEVGVALLLFALGLEFTLTKLKDLGEVIIFGALIQILLVTLFGALIFPVFGFDFYSSLFLGAAFSLSSTAAVLKTLSDRGEMESLHGELSAGWLFMQDLYTLPLIILLPAIGRMIRGEESFGTGALIYFFKSLSLAVGAFFIVLYIGKKITPFLFEKVAELKSRELLLIAAVGFCLFLSSFFNSLGISYAVGAFIAGILLSSSSSHHGIFAEIRPIRDLFSTVFFVSLGFMLDPTFFLNNWFIILCLVLIVMVMKIVISTVLVFVLGYHAKTATLVGVSLASVGEFAFILGLTGFSAKLITRETYNYILSVSFISLILSMPILIVGEKFYYMIRGLILKYFPFGKNLFHRLEYARDLRDKNIEGHVVVLGHGRVGKYVCKALSISGIEFMVVDYNHVLVKKLRSEDIEAVYGDPAEIDVLKFVKIDKAKYLIIAYADRQTQEIVITNALSLNPSIKIICRAHYEEDYKKLKSIGVHVVVQPEFEASLVIARTLLKQFSLKDDEIEEKIGIIKKVHGYN